MSEAIPRFVTPRNPQRETLAPLAFQLAKELNIRLMPWQKDLFEGALEVDSDGHFIYRDIRFATPRQSGKSLTLLVRALLTARKVPRSLSVYTAQNGMVARERVSREWGPIVMDTPSLDAANLYLANGSERIVFNNGSRIVAVPNSLSAGHGLVVEWVGHDEIFAWPDDRLIQALRPAMITKRDAQTWSCSTAGTVESETWRALVDEGRARTESGDYGRVYYVEYSAPDDADPDDEEVWKVCSPALGITIDLDVLKGEHDSMPIDAFRRAYLNQWTAQTSALIPAAAWRNCLQPDAKPEGTLHLALDIAPGQDGGRSTAFVVCGSNHVLEVVDHRAGTGWAIERLADLDQRHSFATVSVDSVGPIRSLLNEIENTVGRKRLRILGTSDACAASGRLHQAIIEGEVFHRDQDPLNAAVEGAAKRLVGDSWVIGRKVSSVDVSPLVAAALAHHAAVEYGDSDGKIL